MDKEAIMRCQRAEKQWMCPVDSCGKVLSRQQTLVSHIKTVHELQVNIPTKRYKEYDYDPFMVPKPKRTHLRHLADEHGESHRTNPVILESTSEDEIMDDDENSIGPQSTSDKNCSIHETLSETGDDENSIGAQSTSDKNCSVQETLSETGDDENSLEAQSTSNDDCSIQEALSETGDDENPLEAQLEAHNDDNSVEAQLEASDDDNSVEAQSETQDEDSSVEAQLETQSDPYSVEVQETREEDNTCNNDIPVFMERNETEDVDMEICSMYSSGCESDNITDNDEDEDEDDDEDDENNIFSADKNGHTIKDTSTVQLDMIPLYTMSQSSQPVSYKEHITAVGLFATRHNLSDTALQHLLHLIDLHLPESNLLERNIDIVKEKCGFTEDFISYYKFCQKCDNIFPSEQNYCLTPGCGRQKENSRTQSNFATGKIEEQLKLILARPDSWSKIRERSSVTTSTITDITDGSEYKKLKQQGRFLYNSNNITLSLFTDGIPLFKSSSVSLWPVYLLINELPRNERFHRNNMILWGIWQGKGKPNMTTFLKSLVTDLQDLYDNGFEFQLNKEVVVSRAMLIVVTMDLQARASILHMTQHNGEYSCIFCMEPGEVVKSGKGYCRSFPFRPEAITLRTDENIRADSALAQERNKKVNGFTGDSVFNYLPGFSLCNNIVIDYMHGILLGVNKKLLSLWFESGSYQQPYFIGHKIKEVDKMMQNISPPYLLNRLPRKLSKTMTHWKASEIRSWLLYYSLPCLKTAGLCDVYLVHYSTLVEATYILLGEGISSDDLRRAELLLKSFVQLSDQLYGKSFMGLNVHNLLHLVSCVEKWGPLWAWSCFCFESFNGEIKRSVHGTGNVCKQIFWSLQAQKFLQNLPSIEKDNRLRQFLKDLSKGRLHCKSPGEDAYQCQVLKPKSITTLPKFFKDIQPLLNAETNSADKSDFYIANKIIRNNVIMYSKSCTRVKKRNSYTLKLKSQDFALEVEYYIIHTETDHVFAVGKKFAIVGGILPNRSPHIKELADAMAGHITIEKAEHLEDLYVAVKINAKTYVVTMPNTIERE